MPDPNRWKALAIVCAAFFMTVLDVSIVNVALPSIGDALHFSKENLQWVITAYAITFGGFLLLGGRGAEQGARHLGRDRRLGRRRGRPRRRSAHEVPGLGVDLLRQRPRRRAR